MTAFLGSMYVCGLLHAAVKKNLQNVNYLGGEPVSLRVMLGYAFTKRALFLLAAGAAVLVLFWLVEKGKRKTAVALVAGGVLLGLWYLRRNGIVLSGGVENRLGVNDFSGQWGVLRNLFTVNGLIRLGISMTGKWFYMASVSGLVVCWGIFGLFRNAFLLLRNRKEWKIEQIWLLGVLLAWFSTFMISSI